MTMELGAAIIAGSSALLGSVIGGIVSYFTTINSARFTWKREQLDKKIASLVELHGDFLAEAGRVALLAIDKKHSNAEGLVELHSLLSRIRLLSDARTVEAALLLSASARDRYWDEDDKEDTEGSFSVCLREMCECSRNEIALLRKS